MNAEQNALLTQTGPQTVMGNLLRRYWIPILISQELPEPSCPPCESKSCRSASSHTAVARKYRVDDQFCAHRGVSLWFDRNVEGGIRCPYHGWKCDRTGQWIDVPSEPPESGYCQKIKLKSYPCVESGGIIWCYMGPIDQQPSSHGFEWSPRSRSQPRIWFDAGVPQSRTVVNTAPSPVEASLRFP